MESKFSQNLKYLRSEKSLAQSQLAEMLNYTQSNISEWEKGTVEPKATAIITISEFFGVTADYLLGLEDDFGARPPAPTHNTSALPSDEQELLSVYRSLDSDTQATLWSLLNTWKPVTSLKTKNKSVK